MSADIGRIMGKGIASLAQVSRLRAEHCTIDGTTITDQLVPSESPVSRSLRLAGDAAAAASLVVSSSELAEVRAPNLPVALISSRFLAEEVVFQVEQGGMLSFETVVIRAIGRLAPRPPNCRRPYQRMAPRCGFRSLSGWLPG
ncbi:hypothetical protein [Paracoccus sp. SM22M-07]|uniref:hypothetical protein n=1 Tax=Paracoccus sp. SM22M-07 TaxID=1520813 RepID=UPI001114DC8D|nr:hypothetical protein [Paracoccus sp. SM22M-07]